MQGGGVHGEGENSPVEKTPCAEVDIGGVGNHFCYRPPICHAIYKNTVLVNVYHRTED